MKDDHPPRKRRFASFLLIIALIINCVWLIFAPGFEPVMSGILVTVALLS